MKRDDVISLLQSYYVAHSTEYGISKLGVFGSVARGTESENSDVDIIVALDSPKMLNMIAIKQELEEILNTPVDLVRYRDKMNSFLKERIDEDAIYV